MRRSKQREQAVFALYQHDLTGRALDDLVARDASEFTRGLVDGVVAAREELDGLIAKYAQGWALDRIAPLERNILRVALFEITHSEAVPREVAINEAVELAKRYCGTDAPKFVNGILGAIGRDGTAADTN